MIKGLDGLTGRSVHRGTALRPPHAKADDRAPAVFDAPAHRALIGHGQAMLAGGLTDRVFSRGMQS
jgi:hypothetical protein